MTDKPDVEKWVEAAARALALRSGVNFDKLPRESNRDVWRSDARACLNAFLRAADGFRLVRVPDEPAANHSMGVWGEGFIAARSEILASAVEVGE